MANSDETRELVKRLVKERLVEKAGVQNIVYHGEEVNVTIAEDGSKRLNLPRLRKAYAVMSGRVYEREFGEDEASVMVRVSDEQGPIIETQLNYRGDPEKIDATVFSNRVICSCGNVRYVKKQDLFQVTQCKPCTASGRNERRRKKARIG